MSHSELAPIFRISHNQHPQTKKTANLFCSYSHASMALHFFQDGLPVFHPPTICDDWREGIFPLEAFNLESSIILRTKGWGGKGRQSKGNLAAGAENGQHQSTHIDSKYCLYLKSTVTPTFIQIWLYVPFYIFHLIKTKIHYKWKGNRKHIPSCSIKPRPFLCLVKFTLEYSRTEPFVQKLKCKVVFELVLPVQYQIKKKC